MSGLQFSQSVDSGMADVWFTVLQTSVVTYRLVWTSYILGAARITKLNELRILVLWY